MNEFYVYAWLRPCGTPFYIGKGKGKRAEKAKAPGNTLFANIVRKIRASGLEPSVVKWFDHLLEADAFHLERAYIKLYGRVDNGTGILANMTDGGEGASCPSSETLAKRSVALKASWSDPEKREKRLVIARSDEVRAKHSDAWSSDGARDRRTSALKAANDNADVKERRSQARISVWRSEDGRAVMMAGNAKPEGRRRKSEGQIRHNSDPNVREKKRVDQIRRYKDPAERERTGRLMREAMARPGAVDAVKTRLRLAPPRSDNKTGFKGVSFIPGKGKYRASIQDDGKVLSLGYYTVADEAARAYDLAAIAAWGSGNCYLNFPEEAQAHEQRSWTG